jgi:glycosyltransferase involved in cell wall biosynthesis
MLINATRGFLDLRQLLLREEFDLLHAHTRGTLIVGLMAATLLHRPVLFTNHNFARRTGLYRRAAKFPNFSTVLLTPNMARHYRLVLSPPKINLISACCGDSMFEQSLMTRELHSHEHRPLRLVGMGSIVRWKNWQLILEAILRLSPDERRKIQFLHWGPTLGDPVSLRYEQQLRQFVRAHNLEASVSFNGMTQAVSQCLRRADWFVLPSTNEPCSVALIEALALGIPALVSASGGNIDIVQDQKTGLFFVPESVPDLATKFQRILQRDFDWLAPEDIRESVRGRSATQVGAEYRALYAQLIRSAQKHSTDRKEVLDKFEV